jgi:hypothetical protein
MMLQAILKNIDRNIKKETRASIKTMKTTTTFPQVLNYFLYGDEYYVIAEDHVRVYSSVTREKIQELFNQGQFFIPKKTPEFEKRVQEEFVYTITDTKIAEKLFESVNSLGNAPPFQQQMETLGLMPLWEAHLKKSSSNALINWLVKNDIKVADHDSLAPQIIIISIDNTSIPDEMAAFVPHTCTACSNKESFAVQYFRINQPCENILMEQDAGSAMTEQGLGWQFLGREKKDLIAASKCPKCNATALEWDFK